jgi:hypothetical protein
MGFPLDDDAKRTIQHHFRRKKLIWSEEYFVSVLDTSEKRFDIYWAVLALRDCGTVQSIPALKKKLFYPMQDVKCAAILTIAHIAGASATDLYFRQIRSKLKNGKLTNGTLVDGLEFLGRYLREDEKILSFFRDIEGFGGKLLVGERIEIAKRVPYFSNLGESSSKN